LSELTQAQTSIEPLGSKLDAIFRRHPAVAAAYLFGSVARGEAGPDSDLDVGVVYDKPYPNDRDRIATQLALEIGRAVGMDAVDVVDLEAQGPLFCQRVLLEGSRLYEGNAGRRIDFESDAIVRALDFRPTYDLATQGKPAALRRWLRQRYDLRTGPDEARSPEGESDEAR
jgi:predicted nucleotidyltransferase